jgi:hypothetical protein
MLVELKEPALDSFTHPNALNLHEILGQRLEDGSLVDDNLVRGLYSYIADEGDPINQPDIKEVKLLDPNSDKVQGLIDKSRINGEEPLNLYNIFSAQWKDKEIIFASNNSSENFDSGVLSTFTSFDKDLILQIDMHWNMNGGSHYKLVQNGEIKWQTKLDQNKKIDLNDNNEFRKLKEEFPDVYDEIIPRSSNGNKDEIYVINPHIFLSKILDKRNTDEIFFFKGEDKPTESILEILNKLDKLWIELFSLIPTLSEGAGALGKSLEKLLYELKNDKELIEILNRFNIEHIFSNNNTKREGYKISLGEEDFYDLEINIVKDNKDKLEMIIDYNENILNEDGKKVLKNILFYFKENSEGNLKLDTSSIVKNENNSAEVLINLLGLFSKEGYREEKQIDLENPNQSLEALANVA